MTRFSLNAAIFMMLAVMAGACGDSVASVGPSPIVDPVLPTEPTTCEDRSALNYGGPLPCKFPPIHQPEPTLISCEISAPKRILTFGEPVQAKAVAKYRNSEDGSETDKDVTNLAAWSVTKQDIVTVSSTGGLLTPKAPGDAVVAAEFEGKRCEMAVSVSKDVPWANLPPISAAAKNFIEINNLRRHSWSNGGVTRFKDGPIKIYADAPYNRQNLDDAINIWVQHSNLWDWSNNTWVRGNRKLSFQVVSNRDEAGMVFNDPPRFPRDGNYCENVEVELVRDNVILKAHNDFWRGGTCDDRNRAEIAGLIGYMLGLSGFTTGDTDVMDRGRPAWNISPLLAEIVSFLYSVPPGIRPQ